MKKILLTLDFPPEIGGIQRYLYEIVKHTYTINDLVLTIGKANREDLFLPCPVKRIPLFINKKFSLLPLFFTLFWYFIKGERNIVVFCGNIYPALISYLMSIIFHFPYYIYCYGTELLGIKKKKIFIYLWKIIFNRAEVLYYLSNTTKGLIDSLKIKCNCIENPPKIELPNYSLKEKNYNKNRINILSVGRLVPHKGQLCLLKAASLLNTDIDWQLKIIGDGPLYKKLTKEIKKYSLCDHVTIERNVPDSKLKNYYIESDIFVFPSIEAKNGIEGFGIVLLEAMAYGVAIVASRCGGIEDIFLSSPESAILVPPDDPDELSKAIILLVQNVQLRIKMSLCARKYLEEKYVWQ